VRLLLRWSMRDRHGRRLTLMASRAAQAVHTEVAYQFRMLFSMVPSLRAPAEQRADFELYKAVVFEAYAVIEPVSAAQALQRAANAKHEAHAIAADF
jgi:hypothetical protein